MEEEYTDININEHNFQNTKDSLKELLDKNKEEIKIDKVPFKGGLLNLFDHNVTGEELNNIISQLQNYMISSNNIHKRFTEEFVEIYNAFEYLDKDYIAAIITSIKSIEEISKKEQQDRKDIRNIIYQLEQSVKVLKKFKEDIDKLKHINDVDKLWNIIKNNNEHFVKSIQDLTKFKEDINKLNHINDIDDLWTISENNKNTLDAHSYKLKDIKNDNEHFVKSIQDLTKFKEDIDKLNYINDIDDLWNITENNSKNLNIHSGKFIDFNKQIQILNKKIKIYYFIAVVSLSITAVHFILNILGIV
ncbi:hypothetical protein [uncultured Brachyspira sp.]|uniref:hypothetical protein n=1 Tax=uncultured Brachyspira sp. TaxID=221953 RepID=UPI002610999B|nr:hypothetical protein [uncultured Brachyspira sp.]